MKARKAIIVAGIEAIFTICGFIARLVRASHRHCEVTGSNPVQVLNFSGFFSQFAKIAFITAKVMALLKYIIMSLEVYNFVKRQICGRVFYPMRSAIQLISTTKTCRVIQ